MRPNGVFDGQPPEEISIGAAYLDLDAFLLLQAPLLGPKNEHPYESEWDFKHKVPQLKFGVHRWLSSNQYLNRFRSST